MMSCISLSSFQMVRIRDSVPEGIHGGERERTVTAAVDSKACFCSVVCLLNSHGPQ